VYNSEIKIRFMEARKNVTPNEAGAKYRGEVVKGWEKGGKRATECDVDGGIIYAIFQSRWGLP